MSMPTQAQQPILRFRDIAEDAPLFIVLNVGSGKHDPATVRATIEGTLTRLGRSFLLREVGDPAKLPLVAAAVVEEARARSGVVVAAGGDGTINTVAQATLKSGCPLGLLPLGTFNYFSRTHGIPSDIEKACEILASARAASVQVGLLNERVFLVNASAGLYPGLLQDREKAKNQLGRSRLVAALAAISSLLRPHRKLRLEIESDEGKRALVTPSLFVGNNRLQLERVGVAESSVIERGRLVAIILRESGFFAMLGLLLRAVLGRLGEDERITSFAFSTMTIRPRFGLRRRFVRGRFQVATDGEVSVMAAPLVFRVAKEPLLLLRPEGPVEDPG
jgi:diacylglycerol kinase family enzyme